MKSSSTPTQNTVLRASIVIILIPLCDSLKDNTIYKTCTMGGEVLWILTTAETGWLGSYRRLECRLNGSVSTVASGKKSGHLGLLAWWQMGGGNHTPTQEPVLSPLGGSKHNNNHSGPVSAHKPLCFSQVCGVGSEGFPSTRPITPLSSTALDHLWTDRESFNVGVDRTQSGNNWTNQMWNTSNNNNS